MRFNYPGLDTLFITGMTYFVLDGMIECVALPEPQKTKVKTAVKYISLGFGFLSLVKFDKTTIYPKHKTTYREKIELLCNKDITNSVNDFQKTTLNNICNDLNYDTRHDLNLLCTILGNNDQLCKDIEYYTN